MSWHSSSKTRSRSNSCCNWSWTHSSSKSSNRSSHGAGTGHRSGNRHRNRRSARLRRETSHGQAGGGNDDHQNTLHRSILQNSVKQGKLLPSMTATLVTRKRCTDSNKNRRELPQSTAAVKKQASPHERRSLVMAISRLIQSSAQDEQPQEGSGRASAQLHRSCSGRNHRDDGTSHRINGNDGRNHMRFFRSRMTAQSCWHNRTTAPKQPERHIRTRLPRQPARTTARWLRRRSTTARRLRRTAAAAALATAMVAEQTKAGVRTALKRYRNTNQHRQSDSGTNYEILIHLNPPSENNSWPDAHGPRPSLNSFNSPLSDTPRSGGPTSYM